MHTTRKTYIPRKPPGKKPGDRDNNSYTSHPSRKIYEYPEVAEEQINENKKQSFLPKIKIKIKAGKRKKTRKNKQQKKRRTHYRRR